MPAPGPEDTWVSLTPEPVQVDELRRWATVPSAGAVVVFCGTARDHSTGREGVTSLEYEAWEEEATEAMRAVADRARRRWPELRRVACHHRTGLVELGEVAVAVVVSAPHRADAFAAAADAIDTLKATVPLWKRERWPGGAEWALEARPLADLGQVQATEP